YALSLASRGARVVVNDIPETSGRPGPAHDVAREINAVGGAAIANEDSVTTNARGIVEAAVGRFGRLDIIVNNAGNTDHAPFEQLTEARFRQQIDLHLMGSIDVCRAAWPHLKKSGTGRIVNITSGGMYGNAGISNYAAAKAGLLAFSRCLAFEAEPFGITVNCIGPNGKSRLTDVMPDSYQSVLEKKFQPDRIAAFVTWLVHQDTKINNNVFEVSGGTATRVVFARFPTVKVDADTPEAWSLKQDDLVSGDGALTQIKDTMDFFFHIMREAAPEHDLDGITDILQENN
ncbi:MAG: SDR family NAD(P)-dependent oxidoreductase, partial [Marinicaulis sp.]|nr:SDR family NAD(P)-dependent oxidoreductase [Marinicaulis sp.]